MHVYKEARPPAGKPPTILDVASEAGVSKSTVSNVVRGVAGVSDETRVKVRAAIDKLGYRPNVMARQLVQQRTNILGVVVGDLANPFFAEMAKLVERHAASRGYTAMFCNTEGDRQSELAGVETLLEYRVAGIVFLAVSAESSTLRETLEHKVPVVFIGCHEDWGDVVSVDDVRGGRLGTDYLINAGHRRIAFLSIPELEGRSDLARLQGYKEAMRQSGLEPPVRIRWSPPSEHVTIEGVERGLRAMFTGPDRITAVFASNDFAAIYLQEFADRVNLRVPGDVSIIGFDDVAMAGLARIGLTTVAQPREELARQGIAALVERIDGKRTGPARASFVGVELVARNSTAPNSNRDPGGRKES
ncbi:MAG: LacI family DNA-binding transcriptional regulator [Candidatus Dormiibacterota bacterium]